MKSKILLLATLLITLCVGGAIPVSAYYSPTHYSNSWENYGLGYDINSESDWVSSGFNVGEAYAYEGTKSVEVKCSSKLARYQPGYDINQGDTYWAFMATGNISSDKVDFSWYTSSSVAVGAMRVQSNIIYARDYTQAQWVPIYKAVTSSRWYLLRLNYVTGFKSYTVSVNDGTGWRSSPAFSLPTATGAREFQIEMCTGMSNSSTYYIDSIDVADIYPSSDYLDDDNERTIADILLRTVTIGCLIAMGIAMLWAYRR